MHLLTAGVAFGLTFYQITASPNPTPGVDSAKARAEALALAKALIAKLKG